MKPLVRILLIVTAVTVLSGCGSMRRPGFPRQSYNEKKQIQVLEKQFETGDLIKNYYALTNAPEAVKKEARNQIIDGRLVLMNLNYNQFVSQFCFTKQTLDAGTEIVELGLNLATTAVGGASAKTVLGAVSAGVTGSKLAIDKNFFFERTVPVLVTSMNAQRKVALAPLLIGMANSTEKYPLAQALSDLDAYYFAGTFMGALQSIQADAGVKEERAQNKINSINSIRFEEDESAKQIRAWLFPEGPQNPDTNHLAALKAWKKDRQLEAVNIERFLEEKQHKENREQAIDDLEIPAVAKPEDQ